MMNVPISIRQGLTDEMIDAAFHWLATSSEEMALARATKLRKDFHAKRTFARLFRKGEGSVEMRKAWATDHDDYALAMEEFIEADRVWDLMSEQKDRAKAILEAWRTLQANERPIRNFR